MQWGHTPLRAVGQGLGASTATTKWAEPRTTLPPALGYGAGMVIPWIFAGLKKRDDD